MLKSSWSPVDIPPESGRHMHGQLVRELRVMLVSDTATGTVDWDWDSGLGQWTGTVDSGLGQWTGTVEVSPLLVEVFSSPSSFFYV